MPALQMKNAPAAQQRSGAGHQEVSPVPEESYKACARCGETKPLADFHKRARSRDGRQSYCKECQIARNSEWNRENRDTATAHSKAWQRRNPEKVTARWKVQRAIQRGVLVRPDRCSGCGKECEPQAHHEDYSRPFDVVWLCPRCHGARHAEETDR